MLIKRGRIGISYNGVSIYGNADALSQDAFISES
jgi:hypothetical protein